jgi:hypothetical protein
VVHSCSSVKIDYESTYVLESLDISPAALASVEGEVDVGRGEAASFVAVVGEHGERVVSAEKRRVGGRRENGGGFTGRRREEEGGASFDPRTQPISSASRSPVVQPGLT